MSWPWLHAPGQCCLRENLVAPLPSIYSPFHFFESSSFSTYSSLIKRPFVFRQHLFTSRSYGSPGFYITYPFIFLIFLLLALCFIPFLFSVFLSIRPSTKARGTGFMCLAPLSLVVTWPKWHAERFPWHATFTVVAILIYFFAWPEYLYIYTHTHMTAYRLHINYRCYQIITLRVRKFLHKSGTVWNVECILTIGSPS